MNWYTPIIHLHGSPSWRPNFVPSLPVPTDVAPVKSCRTLAYNFDELWVGDKVSWTIQVSPYGSVYCSLQQSYATASGTWYNLQAPDTEPVTPHNCYEFEVYSLYYGLKAFSRRVSSTYLYDLGGIRWGGLHGRISSRAVSMAGHLNYLVPAYEQDSLEAKVKDEVVHFESVTLAEEQALLNRFRVAIQILRGLGWSECRPWLQKRSLAFGMPYWHTFFSCLCGSCGINSAVPV